MEKSLAETEARYRLLVENANDAIVSIDGEGVFLFMNRAAAEQLGGRPEDFEGKTMWDVFPKEAADRQVDSVRGVLQSGQGRIAETMTVLKGENRWYRTNMQPMRHPDGGIHAVMMIASDITETREIRERLDLALRGTNAGLWDWHVQTGKTVFNERWAEIVGHTLEELEPVDIRTWVDLCHPDDLAASNAHLERHFAGETDFYRCECRMRHKDGSWVWVLDQGRVVERDGDGKPVRMTGTHVDITERKRYEAMLRAERDMAVAWSTAADLEGRLEICLRTAIEVSSMDCGGIYLVDRSDGGMVLAVSLGLTPGFVHASSRHAPDSGQVRLVQKGIPFYARQADFSPSIREALMKEGMRVLAVIPVVWQGRLIACLNIGSHTLEHIPEHARLNLESIARYAGSFVAQELQQEEIRQGWKDLDAFFNTVQDMLFILDQEGRMIHINQMACDRLEYASEDLKGKHVLFVHPEDRHKEALSLIADMLAGKSDACPIPLRTRSGRLIPVETRVLPGQWRGEEVLFGISRDISERLALQERNEQIAKAESLRRMAGAVAHHFNNTIAGVIGYLELAQVDGLPVKGVSGYLSQARRAAERAADMSGLMLTYTGFSLRNPVVFDLSEACNRRVPRLRDMLPGNLRLLTDFASPGPVVRADVGQIGQVLTQLIANAWEAIGQDQGEIRAFVRTARRPDLPRAPIWPADWRPEGEAYAVLGVSDTGCGIPAGDMGKLMDPFFSTKFTGRGMGLAVVLGIVQSHRGVISVRSAQGRGSLFQVFLPLWDEKEGREGSGGVAGSRVPQATGPNLRP